MRQDYDNMKVTELRQETRDRGFGLMYLGELKRDKLIEALRRHDKGMTPVKPLAGWDDYGKRKPVEPTPTVETCECCHKPLSECEQEKTDIWDHNHSEPEATATTETIDITPVGLQTPDGIQRTNEALKRMDDTTAEVANKAIAFLHELLERVELPNSLTEDLKELTAAIDRRSAALEEFARAIGGAPPLDPDFAGKAV